MTTRDKATRAPNQRYVLIDRDGVLNQDSEDFIKSPAQWQPLPGSLEAVALLNQHGYEVIVITNQSGLARGLFDETVLTQIHSKMHRMLAECGAHITKIYFCPHGPDSACNCRKPKPGLLQAFAADFQVNLNDVFFIGDAIRDVQAALAAGAKPLLVKTGQGQQTQIDNPNLNIPVFEDLYDAAKYLTSRS